MMGGLYRIFSHVQTRERDLQNNLILGHPGIPLVGREGNMVLKNVILKMSFQLQNFESISTIPGVPKSQAKGEHRIFQSFCTPHHGH